jgi:hypothetical protein
MNPHEPSCTCHTQPGAKYSKEEKMDCPSCKEEIEQVDIVPESFAVGHLVKNTENEVEGTK